MELTFDRSMNGFQSGRVRSPCRLPMLCRHCLTDRVIFLLMLRGSATPSVESVVCERGLVVDVNKSGCNLGTSGHAAAMQVPDILNILRVPLIALLFAQSSTLPHLLIVLPGLPANDQSGPG